MMLRKGERLRCQNAECAAEIEVTKESIEGESAVTCCCGAVMKKPYSKPALGIRAADGPILAKHSCQKA
jgi:CDGSH-type Zn-finger protein